MSTGTNDVYSWVEAAAPVGGSLLGKSLETPNDKTESFNYMRKLYRFQNHFTHSLMRQAARKSKGGQLDICKIVVSCRMVVGELKNGAKICYQSC